ncbi:ankyrin repeat-containing domain protein [Xylariomycetidae sp. FL2044]|nr:ankyrin repeat-containing domain protein [Xylariomycetidae sp. FL2044]
MALQLQTPAFGSRCRRNVSLAHDPAYPSLQQAGHQVVAGGFHSLFRRAPEVPSPLLPNTTITNSATTATGFSAFIMEAAGLGIGVAGLASLLTTVRDIKEGIDSYKNFTSESRPHFTQLDAAATLYQQWAESVGFDEGGLPAVHHKSLDNPAVLEIVTRLSQSIRSVIGDRHYPSPDILSSSKSPASAAMVQDPRMAASRKNKALWALKDKTKVTEQAQLVAALLQTLRELVPPSQSHNENHQPTASGANQLQALMIQIQDMIKQVAEMHEASRNAEFKKNLSSWLGSSEMTSTLDNFVQRRLDGTCDWIFQRAEFLQWRAASREVTKVLWIHGPAGYGKTVLCAKIIEHSKEFFNTPLAYYFFSSDPEHRADPFSILRSWLSQIIQQTPEAFDLAREVWENATSPFASSSEIKNIFEIIIKAIPSCILIVDGLDECVATTYDGTAIYRDSLVDFLIFLQRVTSDTQSRLVIVSRYDMDIRDGLYTDPRDVQWELSECRISPLDVKPDATLFSRTIVNRKLYNKAETQREELSQRLVDRCDSMFLCIKLLEGQLRGGKGQAHLQRSIDQAPTGLNDLYDRSWRKIMGLPDADRKRALAILRWITFVLRPMTVREITDALLLVDEDVNNLQQDELPDEIDDIYIDSEILGLCGSLIETRGSDTDPGLLTLHLTHFSVKQYILCHRLAPGDSLLLNEQLRASNEAIQHNVLAKTCLRYLNCDEAWAPKESSEGLRMIQAFRRYAVHSWHQHVKPAVENSRDAISCVNNFFLPGNKKWESWRKEIDIDFSNARLKYDGDIESGSPLFYASHLELLDTLSFLLTEVALDVDFVDSSNRTALLAAASRGWTRGVEYLLTRGANVNIRASTKNLSPLYVAVYDGHLEVVKLLLEKGADPDSRCETDTPLLSACLRGYLDIVKVLLQAGANPLASDDIPKTAIHSAVIGNSVDVVKFLLDQGLDVDSTTRSVTFTALCIAALLENIDVMRLLLNRGADINWASGRWTPLCLVALYNRVDAARFLIINGAHVNPSREDGIRPLAIAAQEGHTDISKFLVDSGAYVNSRSPGGWTPLHLAATKGHVGVVRLLTDKGADINLACKKGLTALIMAAFYGHIDVVRLLADRGADLHLADQNAFTPLHSATYNGHLDLVRLLAERGVNVDPQDKDGVTPLISAASHGYIDIVRLLADRGANIHLADNKGRTPLHRAAYHGHYDVVRFLVDRGANVHMADNLDGTPLSAASCYGQIDLVRLLVDSGADPNVGNHMEMAPLLVAVTKGHRTIVQFLLDHGADVTASDSLGRNALFCAVIQSDVAMLDLLVANGANVQQTDKYGLGLLAVATGHGNHDIMKALLAYPDIDLNARDCFGRILTSWAPDAATLQILLDYAKERNVQVDAVADLGTRNYPRNSDGCRCIVCTLGILKSDGHYQCDTCGQGHFHICAECHAFGARCLDEIHELVWKSPAVK